MRIRQKQFVSSPEASAAAAAAAVLARALSVVVRTHRRGACVRIIFFCVSRSSCWLFDLEKWIQLSLPLLVRLAHYVCM